MLSYQQWYLNLPWGWSLPLIRSSYKAQDLFSSLANMIVEININYSL